MEVVDYKKVKQLFEEKCKHKDAYYDESILHKWHGCEECDLSKIPWELPDFGLKEDEEVMTRTLCFAVWHEDYLNDKIEHIQNNDCPLFSQTVLVHKGVAYMPLIEVRRLLRELNKRAK